MIGDRSFAAIAMCTGIYAEFAAVFAGARLTKRSLVSIAICLVAMLLTGKRITIIMLLGGLLIVMLLSNSRKIRKAVIGILAALIVPGGDCYGGIARKRRSRFIASSKVFRILRLTIVSTFGRPRGICFCRSLFLDGDLAHI